MSFEVFGDGIALRNKGDILSSDGTSGYVVPVGTEGQILTAQSSTISGLAWTDVVTGDAQKFVFISSTTISAATATVTLSSIPQTYRDLLLIGSAKSTATSLTTAGTVTINFNANTGSLFDRAIITAPATATTISDSFANGNSTVESTLVPYDGSSRSVFETHIMNYTTSAVTGWSMGGWVSRELNNSAKGRLSRIYFNARGAKTPVTSINVVLSPAFATQGFRLELFGIKE
jgi:hypothetical protein